MLSLKRFFPLFFLTFLLFSCRPERDLHFFYLELCPSCDEYVAAEKMAEKVEEIGGHALNIIQDKDAIAMKDVLEGKGLADIARSLPLLIEGDRYFVGYDDIEAELVRLSKEK